MKYPSHLVKQVKEQSAPYQLEGFLSGQGPENPKFMLLGEAPGETEIHNGIPFSGRAGKQLMDFLERIQVKREEVYITSAVRSRPYKWREKKNEMVKSYRKSIIERQIKEKYLPMPLC